MAHEKLTKSALFKGVDQNYAKNLIKECSETTLKPGDFLFHQGDMGKGMYIIAEGTVDIVLEKDDKTKTVAKFSEGAFFGEVCMLEPQERTAGVRAKTACTLLYMDTIPFQDHVKNKEIDALLISHNIAKILIERLKKANEILANIPEKAEEKVKTREMSTYKEILLSEVLF